MPDDDAADVLDAPDGETPDDDADDPDGLGARGKPIRKVMVPVRFTRAGVRNLDRVRGDWSRSKYIREALSFAVKGGLRGPKPPIF